MIVKLSEAELSDCFQAANARNQFNKASGKKNGKIDKNRTDQEIEYFGCMTELAVAKLFEVDSRLYALGTDGGIDFWLGNISIDIKASFYLNSGLTFTSLKHFRSKVAVLAEYNDETSVKVKGWASKALFERKHVKRNFGYGERCFLQPDDLLPIEKLWLEYKKRDLS